MAGIRSLLFLVFWLLWVSMSPFIVLAAVFAGAAHLADDEWEPWIGFVGKGD